MLRALKGKHHGIQNPVAKEGHFMKTKKLDVAIAIFSVLIGFGALGYTLAANVFLLF
jgi:hypothetical protein